MGWQARTSCQHLDNFNRCRIHMAPRWIRWLMPKGRLPCIFHSWVPEPQDGGIICPDQIAFPRPAPPAPISRKL
jgi:hypothetical protein